MGTSMHIGQGSTYDLALAAGYVPVGGQELLGLISGNTIKGDYLGGFRFVSYLDPSGTIAGTNNVGSDNAGVWSVDPALATLSSSWDRGWASTTIRAVSKKGVLQFFDIGTDQWRMSVDEILQGPQPLTV